MATQRPDDSRDRGGVGNLGEHALPDLLKQLSEETTRLVHQEIELAKAELTQKGKQARMAGGMFGGAGVVGFLALAALSTCFILALDIVLPAWLAALIVAVVYGAIAAVLAVRGRDRIRQAAPPVPEQTIETVKEDVQWAKTQMPSARK